MSDTTPKALRLADWIGDQWLNETIGGITQAEVSEVMQELRDQHELIQKLKSALENYVDGCSLSVDAGLEAREALAAAEAKA